VTDRTQSAVLHTANLAFELETISMNELRRWMFLIWRGTHLLLDARCEGVIHKKGRRAFLLPALLEVLGLC
jgi:hypothetical protein